MFRPKFEPNGLEVNIIVEDRSLCPPHVSNMLRNTWSHSKRLKVKADVLLLVPFEEKLLSNAKAKVIFQKFYRLASPLTEPQANSVALDRSREVSQAKRLTRKTLQSLSELSFFFHR